MSGEPQPIDAADAARRLEAAKARATRGADCTQADVDAAAAAGGESGKEGQFPEFSPEWAADVLAKFTHRRFDSTKPPPPAEPILNLGGTPVLTVGNLAVLCAQSGTGKSHSATATLAAIMAADPAQADCLGWAARNPAGKGVLYCDFEMSAQDHYDILKNALRRAGIDKEPEWFHAYHLTGCEPKQAEQILGALLVDCRERHGGTALAVVDGIADLCGSPNDEAEALALIRRLHGLAIDFATGIFGIIHLNPGSDFKTRGHLGSQAERKAETVIQLSRETETGIIEAFTAKARHKPIPKGSGPRFDWDEDWSGFRSVETKKAVRRAAADAKAAKLARDLFAVREAFTHADACRRIEELEGLNHDAAKKRLAKLRTLEFVTVERATGLYRLGNAAREDDSAAEGDANLDLPLRSISR
jgi:hypothetical protein